MTQTQSVTTDTLCAAVLTTIKRAMMVAMLAACWSGTTWADDLGWLDEYNVAWTSQSAHSGESMPVGGGGRGCARRGEDSS